MKFRGMRAGTRLGLVAGAAATLLAAACGGGGFEEGGGSGGGAEPVKVGVVTGLTGPYVTLGTAQKNGAELVVEELGGKAGKHPISVIVRDDQLEPDAALREAKSLVQSEKVDFLVGCVSAATTLAVNQVAAQAGVPYLGTCQTEQLTRPPNFDPNVTYHVAPLTSMVINSHLPWVCENLGKDVYLLLPDYAWGHEQNAAYQAAAEESGCNVAGTAWFPLGTTDFTPYIPRVRDAKADVVMFGGAGRDQVNFMKQANQFGLKKDMDIFLNLADYTFDKEIGFNVLEGTYGATKFYWNIDDPGVQKFVEQYQDAYGDAPSGYAPYVYNAVRLVADAVAADQYSPEQFRKFMEGHEYNYSQGPESIRACDHQAFGPTYIVEGLSEEEAADRGGSVEDGFREIVETVPPSEEQAPTCDEMTEEFTPEKP